MHHYRPLTRLAVSTISQHVTCAVTSTRKQTMKRTVLRSSLLVFLLFVYAGVSLAQAGASTASVEGHTTDPNGALITGANVTAIAVEKGYSRSATTNQDGEYTLLSLQPGIYDIKIEKIGFAPQRLANVQLTLGHPFHLDLVMQIAAITEI